MSKGQILLGKQRGKVGGFVARVDSSVGQVLSEYNPHPKNPRTLAQTKQRSKMNLAGQISKAVAAECIVGLDPNGRKARSMFVSNLLKNITLSGTSGLDASITYSAIKFAKGAHYGVDLNYSYDDMNSALEVTPVFADSPESVIGVMVVVLEHSTNPSTNPMGPIVQCKLQERSLSPTAMTFDVEGDPAEPSAFEMFVVPVVETSSNVRAAFGAALTETGVIKASALRTIASAQGFGESYWYDKATIHA